MKKATLLSILSIAGLLAGGVIAEAQQPKKISRVGWLSGGSLSNSSFRQQAFRQGLRELGYVEGKNIAIEWRFSEGKADRLPGLAAELARLKVDCRGKNLYGFRSVESISSREE